MNWQLISFFGDSTVLLPSAAALFIVLMLRKTSRLLAWQWSLLFGITGAIVCASKLAFMGWGLGIRELDYTGFSGHSALSAAFWPIFLWLLSARFSAGLQKGNRGATGVFFMTLVTIATVVYWLNPPGNPGVDMACMIIIGFLIYGPVMLIGLHALELAPKKAAGTAAGFTGLFGYLGGSVAASAIVGYTVDFFGWDGGFMVMIGGSVLAVILLVIVMLGERRHHQQLKQA